MAIAAVIAALSFTRPAAARDRDPAANAEAPRARMALTFDDLPRHGPAPPGVTRAAIVGSIAATLAQHRAPAIGFVNANGLTDADGTEALRIWRAAKLPLGNHTFAHVNLDTVGERAFLDDVDRNAAAIAKVDPDPADRRWFRYPFLAEGGDAATRERVRDALRRRGYRIAAVTMGFGDYAWNDAYARCVARGDPAQIAMLESSFLAAARIDALRARTLAHALLGRDIPYVLLLHAGAFDARMLPRLLALYEKLGFAFTTLPQAQADPFYATADDLSRHGPTPNLAAMASKAGLAVPAGAPLPPDTICM